MSQRAQAAKAALRPLRAANLTNPDCFLTVSQQKATGKREMETQETWMSEKREEKVPGVADGAVPGGEEGCFPLPSLARSQDRGLGGGG